MTNIYNFTKKNLSNSVINYFFVKSDNFIISGKNSYPNQIDITIPDIETAEEILKELKSKIEIQKNTPFQTISIELQGKLK